ncbi:MAG TPA: tRNA glutamyl-Q(34) synthetase GluQRS [Caulobacteraceae bacterium]|nr:tRNA glutamyl-Q(34) synthetase GluQRS [Caulobacteraceae bacterium]
MGNFVSRFAPSPSGLLHRGHAFSALTAFEAARAEGGRFLLRIEDIDAERCRPEFEDAIYEDLAWLGVAWETPVRRQSEHMADYQDALRRLQDMGVVYRCFRTRKEVLDEIARAPHGPEPAPFRGGPLPRAEEDARLERGEPYAWRLSLDAAKARLGRGYQMLGFFEVGERAGDFDVMAMEVSPEVAGDVVLARKGLGVAYHLAVVVDDALQGVTQVIRGEDLFEATNIQVLLQRLLGLPTPMYRHHRLLLRPDGKRYAKRDASETLQAIRESGVSANALRRELGFS